MACGASTATAPTPVSVARPATPPPAEVLHPPELGSSLFVDVAACRASSACAPALAATRDYFLRQRPDVSPLVRNETTDPFAGRWLYLAQESFGWEWVMTVTHEHAIDDELRHVGAAATLEEHETIELQEYGNPPTHVLTTHPEQLVAGREGILASALRAGARRRLPPRDALATLSMETDDSRSRRTPRRVEMTLHDREGELEIRYRIRFADEYAAARAEARIEGLREAEGLLAALSRGLLERLELGRDHDTLSGRLMLSAQQGSAAARLLLGMIRLPDDM